jgi:hypothetical protein
MRILIGVTVCHKAVYPEVLNREEPPNNALCHEAARKTWVKEALAMGIDVKFFYGRQPAGASRAPGPDEVFLNADDTYDGLVDKVTHMVEWAYDHGYDYVMKVDIDSYVHVRNFLKTMYGEWDGWDYIGRGWGLGYVLSRRAMRIVIKETQQRSWAEDSHVLRSVFWHADKHGDPNDKVKLYSDGRFCFLPNLVDDDLELYDKEFIVLNPMTPEGMKQVQQTQSLKSLLPFTFSLEDLWTVGDDRIMHCSVHNAFTIFGSKMPFDYNEWCALSGYEKQPFLDWMAVVFACLETEQMKDCPSFKQWMGVIEGRKAILKWAHQVNVDACGKMQAASRQFKKDQAEADNGNSSQD